MSSSFWRPATEYEGIPVANIQSTIEQLHNWKDKYLATVGVRADAQWDFVSVFYFPPLALLLQLLKGDSFLSL